MVVFCFFIVFIFGFSNVYVANVLFYPLLYAQARRGLKIGIQSQTSALLFYLLFILWATLSTFLFAIQYSYFDMRTLLQFLFTVQYIVLIIETRWDEEKFEKYIFFFGLILALILLAIELYAFITSTSKSQGYALAMKYIPGWPNSLPIPLLFGLWVSFRRKKSIVLKLLYLLALYLTTSRIALVGGVIIILYFLKEKVRKNYIWVLGLLVMIFTIVIYLTVINPQMIQRLTVFWDRSDIFTTTMKYLRLRPILGFGGNTIDQLVGIFGNFSSIKNWGHTHSWFLEILLRYGIVGIGLFTGFILSIYFRIEDKNKKFLFFLFLAAALFQTYMRDFVFLIYLNYLAAKPSPGTVPESSAPVGYSTLTEPEQAPIINCKGVKIT